MNGGNDGLGGVTEAKAFIHVSYMASMRILNVKHSSKFLLIFLKHSKQFHNIYLPEQERCF
jgi:hypothetical protein